MNVAILLFHEVEVLDFAGPFEVFSLAEEDGEKCFSCFTVAEHARPIRARNGLIVTPAYDFESCPPADVLIVPGGYGAEETEIHNQEILSWIGETGKTASIVASVCTGAFLLAASGLLTEGEATTHWMDIERLQRENPKLRVLGSCPYVDQGKIVSSAGISAGIAMSLHLVERLKGSRVAAKTARRMEYDWRPATTCYH